MPPPTPVEPPPGRRAPRRHKRAESPLLRIPFRAVTNPWPPLEVVRPEQLDQLHDASLRILEDIGLSFMDAETLSILEQAGARGDHAAPQSWPGRGVGPGAR